MHGPNHRMQRAFVLAIRVIAEPGLMYTITSIAVVCALFNSDSLDGTPFPLLISAAIVRLAQTSILVTDIVLSFHPSLE